MIAFIFSFFNFSQGGLSYHSPPLGGAISSRGHFTYIKRAIIFLGKSKSHRWILTPQRSSWDNGSTKSSPCQYATASAPGGSMGQFVSSGLCPLNPFQSLHLRRNFTWESISFPLYAPRPGVAKHSGTFFWFTQSSSFLILFPKRGLET